MVELELTRSRLRRSARSAAIPASSPAATSSSRAAHSAITAPWGVRLEPRGLRRTSGTPVCASMARIRAETACWLTPICWAALFRLPVRATPSSTSSAPRSGTLLVAYAAAHPQWKHGTAAADPESPGHQIRPAEPRPGVLAPAHADQDAIPGKRAKPAA